LSADIGAEYGDDRPLDNARMRTLAINGVQLLDRIDPNHAFVTELGSVGCITWPQREHIIDTVYRRDRNDKLLEFLTRRSVADFQKFINVLSREQAHLVPLLLTDGGETYPVSLWMSITFCQVQADRNKIISKSGNIYAVIHKKRVLYLTVTLTNLHWF